ncbi:MAG: glycosyltransferase family 4 protein [Chitinophagaceae bacterium]|nr:MAG: glycosyltransferase family 4 protein [Chitinophagaceae bacterium]
MKVAVLSPVAWRTPPRHYGPWEQIASNITEGLVQKDIDVTLFATKDSVTSAKLASIIPKGYEEDKNTDAKVSECMHISYLMERANKFDIIHNHFDFHPLTYSRLIRTPVVTTIHGFSSPKIIPVYKRYNDSNYYVSISYSDRNENLSYIANVYHGIKEEDFTFQEDPAGGYLLFFGRIHPDKGVWEAIQIAKKSGKKIVLAGIIQDQAYFDEKIAPWIDNEQICFLGPAGPEKRNKLLGDAHALLHPIRFNEPFGLSLAESMMCGTPVIAFNKGAMQELINDGETGFLVDTIDEAVAKIPLISQLSRLKCHEWAKSQFSRKRMVDDYIKVYEKILRKAKS